MLLGAGFGLVSVLGKGLGPTPQRTGMTLQISQHEVSPGMTFILHGAGFTPLGKIALTRDAAIPIRNVERDALIRADKQGNFVDVILVENDWSNGVHTLNAEDAGTHKLISFPITVTGHGVALRPAHLELSATSLDFGAGDQATNSTETVTLTNLGDGQITWEGYTTASWLMLSPRSGSFSRANPLQVKIAVDRSQISPADYTAQVLFSSDAGNLVLPVTMQVTSLDASHQAILQVSPVVLSFTATDGGALPATQSFTISNPGAQSMQWSLNSDSSWLMTSAHSQTMSANSSTTVTVSVNTGVLLPGTYNGTLTLTAQAVGGVLHSPQNIYVSVTVLPPCTLQLSSAILSFAGAADQTAPMPKSVTISAGASCNNPVSWHASSSTNWLTVSDKNGVTPDSLTIGINSTGLKVGSYSGSVTLSSSVGTQLLLVNLTLGQPSAPIITLGNTSLTFSGVAGNIVTSTQVVHMANSGESPLIWNAGASTGSGGAWLIVSPTSGTILPHQSIDLTVNANALTGQGSGTYPGSLRIIGTNDIGQNAVGSPFLLPVSFGLQAPCTLQVSPGMLSFAGPAGQGSPAAQPLTLSTMGACTNALNWTSTVSTVSGGSWLTAAASGSLTVGGSATSPIGVSLSSLAVGTYQGSVVVAAQDSVTHTAIGSPQTVQVTLTVQPPCTLQAPVPASVNFTAEAGVNPATQTFTVGVTGTCSGTVTITPSVVLNSGTGWLSISPVQGTLTAGTTASFVVSVTSSALATATYSGSISLAGQNSGFTLAGSPQLLNVGLVVQTAPHLTASPSSIIFNVATGNQSQVVTVGNTGSFPLNWLAALQSTAPSWVTLSATSGYNLQGNTTLTVQINATGLTGGTTYNTGVVISALDPNTSGVTAGSPITIPITINVAVPAMQVSTTTLNYTTTVGTNPADKTLTISNTGGNTLSWTAGSPSQSWLSLSATSGSDASGGSSPLVFSINVIGLAASPTPYTATVVLTPSTGLPATITVSVMVSAMTGSPNPTPTPTAMPSPGVTPTATALTVTPTPTASVTATPATPLPGPSETPVSTALPTPVETPAPTALPTQLVPVTRIENLHGFIF
ncbi:hypothetical protein KTT_07040 [Tengunoibacter tsumagoiensis]|uniref:BACON domain-containing protein n=2 Tax=Tengunoibacter tsumagoiensis TaxID=2014871 RepID=A0A401ZVA2_9CHLR|nr:hypothetical protein KTT_07040 [Tengunoibacter tsumagoiensis]